MKIMELKYYNKLKPYLIGVFIWIGAGIFWVIVYLIIELFK